MALQSSKCPKWLLPYAGAVAIVVFALMADFLLDPLIEVETPFLLFCSAVFLSAWFGGLMPGLVATALAALVANYFFISPHHSFEPIGLMMFVFEGTLISWLAAKANRALKQRKQAQEQYRQIVETGEDGIWLVDQHWRITFANAAITQMLGSDAHAMVGRPLFEFMDESDRESARRRLDAADQRSDDRHEFKFRRGDGAGVWAIMSTSPIKNEQGNHSGTLAMLTDITARKLAEQELAHHRDHLEELVSARTRELEESLERLRLSERMAALGTLSAGLGHDMGNLLMPLRIHLDCIEARGLPSEVGEDLQAIRTVADYLQRLTNGLRLMALSPDGAGAGETTDLNEWWRDVQTFLKNALPKRSILQQRFAPGLPAIAVPRHLLTQAVFNLVHNAGEAMRGHPGQVTVWAEAVEDSKLLRLGVSDNGPGMTPETKRRCLEPFFTTKVGGRSSGLGLALVYLIVKKAGGSIEIDSEVGSGTTFVLNLPVAIGAPATDVLQNSISHVFD